MPKTYSEKMSHRTVILVGVTLALAFIACIVKAAIREWGVNDGGWLAFGFVLFAYSAFFLLGTHFWRSLDDMQRQGQAVSWFWGSMVGLAVVACWIFGTGQSQSEFTKGVGTLVILQLGCSLLLHAFWWLKGRGFSFRSCE